MPGYPYNHRMPKKVDVFGSFVNGSALESIPPLTTIEPIYVPGGPLWQGYTMFSSFFGLYNVTVTGFPDTNHKHDNWELWISVQELAPAPFGYISQRWLLKPPNDYPGPGPWLNHTPPNQIVLGNPLHYATDFFLDIYGY